MKIIPLWLKIIFFTAIFLAFDTLYAQVILTYNSSQSVIIPAGSTNVIGEVWGAGGGSGGVRQSSAQGPTGAGGGGGGAYTYRNFGNGAVSATVTVGQGGIRGESNPIGDAGKGGNSSVVFNGVTITAEGGYGGKSKSGVSGSSTAGGGSGGTANGGTTNTSGQDGESGGGGGTGYGGNGGQCYGTSGGGQPGRVTGNNFGTTGKPIGGGASGAHLLGGTINNLPGAAGANGQAKVTFTPNAPVISGTNIYCEGKIITLTSSYSAGGGVTLQWYKNNIIISGQTGQILTISNCSTTDEDVYKVIATFNNIDYSSASALSVSNLPYGIAFSGTTLSGTLTSNEITVTINQPTQSPIIPVSICEGQSYTGNGFTNISTAGLHTRVISGGNASGCDSTVRINLTIHPKPSNISQEYEDVCPKATSQMVTWASLVGTYTGILHWYAAETGGSEIPEPTAFDASVDLSATYWVSQTIGGCETSRTKVVVNINESPVPFIIPAEVCRQTGSTKEWNTVVVPQSGETIHWYTDQNVANAEYAGRNSNPAFVFSGNTMPPAQDLSAVGTYTIWVILERDSTSCHSVVSPAEIVVNAAPTVNLLSDELCEHTPGEWIQVDFTGQPDFTLNYTVDIAGIGTNLDPSLYGFPTVFGNGQFGIATWTGSGTNWLAGISTVIPGFFTFNVIQITDGSGCQSTRP
ncbi:MAG: immunoglobulin domain-containing protein [Bacteroidales bacterium]|nr:immunoglobulin domain-containing protein [Bacteroidales bacterium]